MTTENAIKINELQKRAYEVKEKAKQLKIEAEQIKSELNELNLSCYGYVKVAHINRIKA